MIPEDIRLSVVMLGCKEYSDGYYLEIGDLLINMIFQPKNDFCTIRVSKKGRVKRTFVKLNEDLVRYLVEIKEEEKTEKRLET
jgi:hypothetical protein